MNELRSIKPAPNKKKCKKTEPTKTTELKAKVQHLDKENKLSYLQSFMSKMNPFNPGLVDSSPTIPDLTNSSKPEPTQESPHHTQHYTPLSPSHLHDHVSKPYTGSPCTLWMQSRSPSIQKSPSPDESLDTSSVIDEDDNLDTSTSVFGEDFYDVDATPPTAPVYHVRGHNGKWHLPDETTPPSTPHP